MTNPTEEQRKWMKMGACIGVSYIQHLTQSKSLADFFGLQAMSVIENRPASIEEMKSAAVDIHTEFFTGGSRDALQRYAMARQWAYKNAEQFGVKVTMGDGEVTYEGGETGDPMVTPGVATTEQDKTTPGKANKRPGLTVLNGGK